MQRRVDPLEAPAQRPAPHNIECEQALLGTLLVYNDSYGSIAGSINERHFFEPLHGRIFELIKRQIETGKPANPVTLRHQVASEEPIGGKLEIADYLYRLESASVPSGEIKAYAETIIDLAARRELILAAEDLIEKAYSSENAVLDAAADAMSSVTNIIINPDGKKTAKLIGKASAGLISRIRAGEVPDSVPTYIGHLDQYLAAGGFKPGQYIVGAGRPGMGKSTIAPQIALNMALRGNGIIYQSLEMCEEDLTARCLSSLVFSSTSPISYSDIANHNVDESELLRLDDAAKKLSNIPLLIDDRGGLTVSEISARARIVASQWRKKGIPLRGIVIDHIGKIRAGSRYKGQKVNEVGEISDALMNLGKELDIFVFALNQLSRDVEKRDKSNRRPELPDLRNSGDIEQDADLVMFFYRQAYYEEIPENSTNDEAKRLGRLEECWHKLETRIAKQRGGALKSVNLFASMPDCAVRNYFEPTAAYTQRHLQRILRKNSRPEETQTEEAA